MLCLPTGQVQVSAPCHFIIILPERLKIMASFQPHFSSSTLATHANAAQFFNSLELNRDPQFGFKPKPYSYLLNKNPLFPRAKDKLLR